MDIPANSLNDLSSLVELAFCEIVVCKMTIVSSLELT